MRHSIVFLDRATLGVPLRGPGFPHDFIAYEATGPDQVVDRMRGVSIVINNKVPLREAALRRLPGLRLIALAATGSDCVDLPFCRENGITVCNVRGYATDTVPEHVLAVIFALRRNLIGYDQGIRQGRWQKAGQFCYFDHPIGQIAGSTLGIVGYGALGQALAARAKALGMKIVVTTRTAGDGAVDLETLLRTSDVVSLHCPLTPQTRNLIGENELALMKPGAILINTARGGLVDAEALARALISGTIAGAGIDVLTDEPPTRGNPLLDLNLPNLIVTPHIAWASQPAMASLAEQLIANIEAFVAGQPRNLL